MRSASRPSVSARRLAAPASALDHKIDGLRYLAFFVGLDIERNLLAFIQSLQTCTLHRSDVHEYVAAAIIRFDEAVTTFTVEELYSAAHCHRETPFPVAFPHANAARGEPDFHRQSSVQ